MKIFYKLYADCIHVKGWRRSLIIDFLKHEYFFIPNILFDILTEYKDKSLKEIKKAFGNEHNEIIDEYFNYLIDKKLVFICEAHELDYFPDISIDWQFPSYITNAIIEYSNIDILKTVLFQLDKLFCKHIQLRFYTSINFHKLKDILLEVTKTSINSIELVLKYSQETSMNNLVEIAYSFPRLQKIIIFSSNDFLIKPMNKNQKTDIIFLKNIIDKDHCGYVSPEYFSTNLTFFSESKKYNTCLNRKASIDENGFIKNCPAIEKDYGNIKDITLKEAIEKPGFKDLWHIHKDKIEVCKDCEFRYMCTDCRVFIKDPKNIYSQPAKCNYNPYIAKWKGQEGYKTVEESIKEGITTK
ncbi:MAG: grasp-with-spasm system SPASM domain peptide maturase [Bacteroidales bacterium]|nr:grasp-with-spasm system SPASM domain peptide maturase [Bacteroidales bacterium]